MHQPRTREGRLLAALALAALAGLSVQGAAQTNSERPMTKAAEVAAGSPSAHVEWGYTGPTGPDHWSALSQDYAICNTGQQESPIDVKGAIPADLGPLSIAWKPLAIHATNNGHTVQYDVPAGSSFSVGGKSYALVQFHLHHPSEHLLNGRRFPLEIHFVHKLADGSFGVVGVLVARGAGNATLQKLIAAIPAERGATATGPVIAPRALLPATRGFVRYEGSLTTPPCAEAVDWVVLRTSITASTAQIDKFASIFPFNARPIQPLDRRFLLTSR
ncbi:carbonic anhydrase [Sphingomonas sp.]|uniref:carbonic anhydrase n=1 Tax=Sphingomonas sp. TaxID=28214 RepID=UPI001DB70E79|nr:carbonic anhydrase family protein [Sphingomonas sp.]MBX9796053.1 carbonic anhydrase family protein [Sphingomonas sp.]